MDARSYTYVIIGAGPTGIGAAHRLKELGEENFIVLDRAAKAGGLASSFADDKGFTWDIGGHVQFSHYEYFDALMNAVYPPDGWLTHKRSAWAWMEGGFVPYPVQNNLRHLPGERAWDCVRGIIDINRTPAKTPQNFREWIFATFGEGLAELFMLPYNFKVWATRPEEMSFQWIGERVAVTDLEKTLKNIVLQADDAVWGPNSMFHFPVRGGTGGIWEKAAAMVGHDKFVFGADVTVIDPVKKEITCADGQMFGYDKLISTMPVTLLCDMLGIDAKGLHHSSSNIVGLGLKGECPAHLADKSWIYFPEDNCPFYRATVFSNYSPVNVPGPGFWSLMTETSESEDKQVDHAALIEDTIAGCIATGLIASQGEVCSTWQYRAPHGYPVPTLTRDAALARIIPALEKLGIYSRGRFGGWKYEVSNQDHSLMQGVELANLLARGEKETTYTV